jgi:hypothetical protein
LGGERYWRRTVARKQLLRVNDLLGEERGDDRASWRKVKSTTTAPPATSPSALRELVDVHTTRIRAVLDNLSTHSAGALYDAFPAAQAPRLLRRLEFH